MVTPTGSTPLRLETKLLCFSLLYLFTSLFLALYLSLLSIRCKLPPPPSDLIQTSPFSYPTSYGEHKYALPTHHSSCNSPLPFPGEFPLSSSSSFNVPSILHFTLQSLDSFVHLFLPYALRLWGCIGGDTRILPQFVSNVPCFELHGAWCRDFCRKPEYPPKKDLFPS